MGKLKEIISRIILKHDTSTNWENNNNFVPMAGELVLYDDLNMVKMGDGVNNVNALSFIKAAAEGGIKILSKTITLPAYWSGQAGAWQTEVDVEDVRADSVVIVSPAPAYCTDWIDYQIICAAQEDGKLLFQSAASATVPNAIDVNVVYW